MASDLSYNDDVELVPDDDVSRQSSNTQILDTSTPETAPSVNPIPVTDSTVRPDDNWTSDTTASGGTSGVTYNDTPPTEKPPNPQPTYITTNRKIREIIDDYSPSYLLHLYNSGAKFYVVYRDGTENEVSYTEIYDPNPVHNDVYPDEALEIAEATNQHFWANDSGTFVTDIEQEEWLEALADNFSDASVSEPYNNILMNSLGILIRSALNTLAAISKSGVSFYDGDGNDLSHMLASFGSDGATFREDGKTKVTINDSGLSIYDSDGSISGNNETLGTRLAFIGVDANGKPYSRIGNSSKGYIDIGVNSNNNGYIDFYSGNTQLAHIGYDAGVNKDGDIVTAPYYTFGSREPDSIIGNYSFSSGTNNKASGYGSHAEGDSTEANGIVSHAEGYDTEANSFTSHAEGRYTKANEQASHAEGYYTEANGKYSHAEGCFTKANGEASHASGNGTIAGYDNQFVIGSYNENLNDDLFEIGNGLGPAARINAFRVTKNSRAYMGSTTVTSDKRIKTDLGVLDPEETLNFITSLIPHKYEKYGQKELGFFAQDVEKDPNYGDILVEQYESNGYEDFRSLSYDGLIAPIVSVEQNLITRIEHLEEENKQLKIQNGSLNERLDNLEALVQQLIAK